MHDGKRIPFILGQLAPYLGTGFSRLFDQAAGRAVLIGRIVVAQSAVRRLENGERCVELVEPGNDQFAASSVAGAAKLRNSPALEETSELLQRRFLLIIFVLRVPLVACALMILVYPAPNRRCRRAQHTRLLPECDLPV